MSDLIKKAEQLERSAQQLRDQASSQEADDCGCDIAREATKQVVKVAATGLLAATTGIVLPTL